jgi:solute carrier family 50 protein (sugar transporter)
MLAAETIILEYVCPAMGMIMANIMFSAPYRDLKQAIVRGHLGSELNPTPWAFMLGNCFGWVTYSILLGNLWIFFANAPGFILSIWLNLGAVKLLYQGHYTTEMRKSLVTYLQKEEEQREQSQRELDITLTLGMEHPTEPSKKHANQEEPTTPITTTAMTDWATLVWNVTSQTSPAPAPHETMVLGIILIWTVCVSFISFVHSFDDRARVLIVGCLVNLNLVFFYGAPLSTTYTVLSDKKSDSIHIPTMITNTLSASFWTAYGLAVEDPFIYVPNGLGALLGVVQIILCVLFPRSNSSRRKSEGGRATNNNEETTGPTSTPITASSLELIIGGDVLREIISDCEIKVEKP